MSVPELLLKSVVYICQKGTRGFKCNCTGFIVGVRSERFPDELASFYLVTAAHCVRDAHGRISSGLHARINRKSKVADRIALAGTWSFDDFGTVGVMQFEPDRDMFDYEVIPLEFFVTKSQLKEFAVGPGHEIVMAGLFTSVPGQAANVPITREGTIAAMPNEPLRLRNVRSPAYLAEVRSLGGLSGSPVCVYLAQAGQQLPGTSTIIQLERGPLALLGVVLGHYESPVTSHETLHTGIAAIAPIESVRQVLFDDELVKRRRDDDAKYEAER